MTGHPGARPAGVILRATAQLVPARYLAKLDRLLGDLVLRKAPTRPYVLPADAVPTRSVLGGSPNVRARLFLQS